jgi:nitroreductase
MSGANSQSWEFIVVQDRETRNKLWAAYADGTRLATAMERMRAREYRHPVFSIPDEELEARQKEMVDNFLPAPLLIIPLYDPRKQWGTVIVGHGEISWTQPQGIIGACTHGHMNMLIHLAAASLGLGSARCDLVGEESRYREILGYPEPLHAGPLIPVGYRAYEPGPCTPFRWPLEKLVHYEKYNMKLYLKNEDFLDYILGVRKLGRPGYEVARERR